MNAIKQASRTRLALWLLFILALLILIYAGIRVDAVYTRWLLGVGC